MTKSKRPLKAAMETIESLHRRLKGKDIEIFALNEHLIALRATKEKTIQDGIAEAKEHSKRLGYKLKKKNEQLKRLRVKVKYLQTKVKRQRATKAAKK